MKLENERTEQMVTFDFELTDEEKSKLLEYGRKHMTDDAILQFAIVHCLEQSIKSENSEIK